MSDEARLPDPWPLIPHLPPESAVIVRRRDADAAADMAKSLALAARPFGVTVLLSPVFATRSHEDTAALGMMRFAAICQATNLPVIALGGISAGRVRRVLRAGAAGVAGIGLFTPRTG